ncbi:Hint domain-containing protein [Gulosibacter massiliensis]|uniref:VG15 protein n=1 Tax=Gulosibacter massiliensis TaxID=2479839 RepID=UPI0013DE53AC|nr:Hint domain-containing protein [Gulosibacter massiliensis]
MNRAVRSAASLAQGDVAELLNMLAGMPPEQAALELKALLPEITDRYGDIAAAAAAEWYEDVRAGELGTAGYARVGSLAPVEQVTSTAAYAAGGLFTESGGVRPMLLGAVQRYVAYAARSTVARNANLEKGEVRWARVPSGAKTCAWCSMLASRGWVYTSKERAGQNPSDFHDECVIGSTVVSGPEADAGYRRYFEGEIVTLVTAAGHELTITPNHPVLTDRGWVKAGLLNEGDNLVSAVRSYGDVMGRPDKDDRPTSIEDAVRALGMVSATRRVSVPGSPEQFHGDGFNSEVDVVTRDDLFWGEGYASLVKPRPELDLHGGSVPCPVHRALGPSVGDLELLGGRPLATSAGLVRGGSLGTALGLGHIRGAELSSLGARASGEAGFFEPSRDDASADPVRVGEGQDAFASSVASGKVGRRWDSALGWVGAAAPSFDPPELESAAEGVRAYTQLGGALLERLAGGVKLDRLVDKRVGQFAGHVFNLSTREGWYIANSITVSNCDCQIVPNFDRDAAHIDGYDPDRLYEMYQEARSVSAPVTQENIAASMRELYPDVFTDGHVH